ncbi:porphobilinogen synthase [Nitrospinae bacterium]|jgi:porphobilinogen synthase|nr:porphobilinogen synthase [Nitrospinota bacterium]
MNQRPRRNRLNPAIRGLIRESQVNSENLVWPAFVQEGKNLRTPVASMPGISRLSIDQLVADCERAFDLGIRAVALFPALEDSLKNSEGKESLNPKGLLQRAVKELKKVIPRMLVITDVALDPYSNDGHDGLVQDGKILNDETLPLLAGMAVAQAEAGADVVAPSDMMDGRIEAIRWALDEAGFKSVLICSYCAKYASAFYGPFRDALESAPKEGDKKTYQMDPANAREAIREILLDEEEGADWILIKPGLPYLDIIRLTREHTSLPVAAYHVSGEYAMLKAAAEKNWLDYDSCLMESLLSIRRAGADMIFTYGAIDAASILQR